MTRRLFTFLTVLSLVLCVGTCALWINTWHRSRSLWQDGGNRYVLLAGRGRLSLIRLDQNVAVHGLSGPAASLFVHVYPFSHPTLQLPLWLFVLAFAPLPTAWLRAAIQDHQHAVVAAGRCPSCGYDLRATPERCPECGVVRPADSA